MFVRITFNNGYAGCDETEFLEVENMQEAKDYATDSMIDYAASYEHVACGWDNDFEDEDEESDYYANCYYDIDEIDEEYYKEMMR